MKKIAIAGASAVLAALPVVGVFAADPAALTDRINITVSETCTFERSSGEGTYGATLAMNALNNSVGSSTFTAICNNATGFVVNATPTSITGTGDAITYSAEAPTQGSGTWTAYKTTAAANIAATGGVLMTSNGVTPAAGTSETVTYKVSTSPNQAKGSYTGTIEYALVQNPAS